MDLYSEFEWRGLLHSASEGLRELLKGSEEIGGYIGFDPTAPSLHVGNLLPIVSLARLRQCGHRSFALVGGGTGLIGDPSGKTSERALLSTSQVNKNVAGIRSQLENILSRAHVAAEGTPNQDAGPPTQQNPGPPTQFVNNADWLRTLRAIALMRDVGKHFTVNWMLAKDSIQRRLETQGGISYTEFSYLLLQAYDFLQLHERYACSLQMGGSDQWGNITAGIELIRRARNAKAHGLVFPLVTTASGTKFGKTETGAVWLDKNLTKDTDFHQFWLNVDDNDAIRYLKFFTFLSRGTVEELEAASRLEPQRRLAQRKLADEITSLVHGGSAVLRATANAEIMFASSLDKQQLRMAPEKVHLARALFEQGLPVVKLLVLTKLASSNSEGARLIQSGAIALDGEKVTSERQVLTLDTAAVADGVFRISKGKKHRAVVEVSDTLPGGVSSHK